MKGNQAEYFQGQRLPTTSAHGCQKSYVLSRQIISFVCRPLHGRRLLWLLLLASVMLCALWITHIWTKPNCYTTAPTKSVPATSAALTESATSTVQDTTPALDLSWTTCPSRQELITSLHFTRWGERLLQELHGLRPRPLKMEEGSWYAVTNGIHVFSAFLTTTVERAIHVVSLVQFRYSNGTSVEQPPLVCAVRTSRGVTAHEARIQPVWTWLQPRLKSAFILCPAPAPSEEDIEVAISVRGSPKRLPVWIRVHRPPEKSAEKCCAVCVRPTFGPSISLWKVAEFIAHYRLIGARHIYLYDLEMSDDLKMMLSHLQGRGVDVTVVPFKLVATSSEVHAHGQMAALYDCMFRSLSNSEYFIEVDFDEFMVPLQYSNISALVYGVEATNGMGFVGSILIRSRYYCAEYPTSAESMKDHRLSLQTRMFALHTKYLPHHDASKYIGRTRGICNAAVHEVVEHCRSFGNVDAPTSMAFINHYRRCCEFAGADPIKKVELELWNRSELFMDDTGDERADLIEKELGVMGLRMALTSWVGPN